MKGKVSKEQIAKWKHDNVQGVHGITTKDSKGKTHITYVKKPTLHEIGAAARFAETDPVKSGKVMFDTCRLGGSEDVETNDEMKSAVMQYLGGLFKVAEFEGNEL